MSQLVPNLWLIILMLALASSGEVARAADLTAPEMTPSDRALADYFKSETAKISAASMAGIRSLADWQARRSELRRQAAEMLGLDPMPARTALNAVVTGKLDGGDFTVEKIYFESESHLYVTANLYLPKKIAKPAPAVLYLCGHSPAMNGGISYGNKTAYQRHGIWFARNGFVCLVIDTLQYSEIPGHHRGTYDEGAWWWNARGYTPAGVETWDGIRALDYLDSRPEVDRDRIGVTGRSGGGAYSWFVAALDDRVKVIAPIAGIADLQSYVVDGAVDGHCDCMFFVNTYRWDYPKLAALCSPRPLLLGNSDADFLFPLDGVLRTHDAVKRIYDFYGAATNFGLVITPGPHKDTQELQVPVFRWFNIHLKQEDPVIDMPATNMFVREDLKVFDKIPADQINTTIQESFEPQAHTPDIPETKTSWQTLRGQWMNGLKEKCFAGWPADSAPPGVTWLYSEDARGIRYEAYEILSQTNVSLRFYVMRKAQSSAPSRIFLRVADESFTNSPANETSLNADAIERSIEFFRANAEGGMDGLRRELKQNNSACILFFPRGVGPGAWSGGAKLEVQLRRRFMLIGQTLDGMRVWDIRRTIQAVRSLDAFAAAPIQLEADSGIGVDALYASLFEPPVRTLILHRVPSSHAEGPDYLNVLKILDIPEAAAMAAERCELDLNPEKAQGWDFLRAMESSAVANLKVKWLDPLKH